MELNFNNVFWIVLLFIIFFYVVSEVYHRTKIREKKTCNKCMHSFEEWQNCTNCNKVFCFKDGSYCNNCTEFFCAPHSKEHVCEEEKESEESTDDENRYEHKGFVQIDDVFDSKKELVERCLKAGCPKGGIVLDPFLGSGTVAVVAKQLRMSFVGFELNQEYIKIAELRLKGFDCWNTFTDVVKGSQKTLLDVVSDYPIQITPNS